MVKKKNRKKSSFKGKVGNNARKQASAGSSYGYLKLPKGVSVFSIDSKRVYLDIMPYVVTDENHMDRDEAESIALVGDLWYKRPFKLHRSIGIENDSFVCLTTIGERCPICEHSKRMYKEGNKDEGKAAKPSFRNLYLVNPKNSKNFDDELHVWDVSQYLFQKKLNEELDEDEDYESFPELEDGKTLKIRSTQEVFDKNKFYETSRIDFEERDEQYSDDLLEDLPSLDDMLTILSYKELEDVFQQLDGGDDYDPEDDDEDEKPKRTKKTTKKKDPDSEEEDDDEDDDVPPRNPKNDEDDDDEEDEKPKKKKPIKREREKPKSSKCPFKHKFGKDFEKDDECDECDLWEKCSDKKDELDDDD